MITVYFTCFACLAIGGELKQGKGSHKLVEVSCTYISFNFFAIELSVGVCECIQ